MTGPSPAPAPTSSDPYISYIHRFFHRWLPVYDWFARSIFWAYGAAVRCIDPRPGLRILDVCTGTGEVALRCARRGAEVVGVDVTPEMLARARAKAARSGRTRGVRFETMDARELRFPDGAFDVAVIAFALHDMPRAVRLEVLREAARVSRGRLVVLDYGLPAAPLARRVATALIGSFETAYFRAFAREGVEPLLEAAGVGSRPGSRRLRRLFPALFSVFEIEL
ncbi:MAG: methyltransferase domain-containing protein [Thermoanaerobaculia bacterium]|nr:methyltransferase domain-containing protein [Thermoanaerobaculia bacterium]